MLNAYDKEGNLLAQIQEEYTTVSIAKGQISQDMMFATLSANNLVNLYKISKEQKKGEEGQAFDALKITK